jgi:methanogenic corrinoid protein MtbC1
MHGCPMTDVLEPVHLAGVAPQPHQHHLCAFFHTPDERYRVLLPFVKEGIERGEKAIHVIDPARRAEHRDRLAGAGINVASTEASGQLEVYGWDEMYLRGGRFDQAEMLARYERALAVAAEQGFRRTRVIGEAEWVLENYPGVGDFMSYEDRVNAGLAKLGHPLVCTYDRSRFGAGLAMDALGAHPAVVMGGVVQTNPLFGEPGRLHRGRGPGGLSALRKRHLAALLAGSRRDALDLLIEEGLWLNLPIRSLYLGILEPALDEIGRLWQAGRISVPQSCLAAEICKAALAQLHPHLPCEGNNGKLVVVACVEGELHDIGAYMVADFLEMAGFDVRFLGANIPTISLIGLVEEQPPHLLALSATTEASLPVLRRTVAAVREVGQGRVPVAVGGQVFALHPGLHEELEISLYATNASEMAAAARSLLNRTLH